MSPAPKNPSGDEPDLTPEELERVEARADEAFIAEEEAKVEKADARADAKEIAEAEPEPAAADAPKPSRRGDTRPRRQTEGARSTDKPVVVRAQAKYVRTSARKARLVCDHIRGKDVEQARSILAFTPRGVAEAWSKLLESAVANAENNHELVGDELRIASVHADEGPTLKRFRPRAMGRATKIRKRTSHLTITLTSKD